VGDPILREFLVLISERRTKAASWMGAHILLGKVLADEAGKALSQNGSVGCDDCRRKMRICEVHS